MFRVVRRPGPGLLVRLLRRRVGLAPPSVSQRLDSRVRKTVESTGMGGCSGFAGVLQPRPSGPPSAAQRRTIGAVARRTIEGLRPRRSGEPMPMGTRWERCQAPFRDEKRARHRVRVLSRKWRVAGRSSRHIPCPARPGAGFLPRTQSQYRHRCGRGLRVTATVTEWLLFLS